MTGRPTVSDNDSLSTEVNYDPAANTPEALNDACKLVLETHRDDKGEYPYIEQAMQFIGKRVFKLRLEDMPGDLQKHLLVKPTHMLPAMRGAVLSMLKDLHHDYAQEIRHTLRLQLETDLDPSPKVGRDQMHYFVALEGKVRAFDALQQIAKAAAFKCDNCGESYDHYQKPCRYCAESAVRPHVPDRDDIIDHRWVQLVLGDNREQEQTIWLSLENDLAHVPVSLSQVLRVDGVIMQAKSKGRQPVEDVVEAYVPYLHVNSIKHSQAKAKLELTDADRSYYRQWAKDAGTALTSELVEAFAPHIYGLDSIKECVLLQIVGADYDANQARPDIHQMIIGDPSTGKSEIALAAEAVSGGVYSTGEGVTEAGLAAGVVKNDKMGRYMVEAGIAVDGNRRLKCLDEIDKMKPQYLTQLYTVMDKGFYRLDKIVHETYETKGAWLITGNPKHGRYNSEQSLYLNVGFPMPLLSRFDLIWILKRQYDRQKTDKKLEKINLQYQSADKIVQKDTAWLAKYLLAAKEIRQVTIQPAVFDLLGRYYHALEQAGQNGDFLPITERQYHGMLRLAIARAKLHLRNTVELPDAERAINLMAASFGVAVATDSGTGLPDISEIMGAMPKTDRDKYKIVKTLLGQLTRSRYDTVSEKILTAEMVKTGNWSDDANAAEFLLQARAKGQISSPSSGWYCMGDK